MLCLFILYFDYGVIGCRDLFLSCPLYFFPCTNVSPITFFVCLFNCLISFLLFPCASVWVTTRAWVPISYGHIYWMVLHFFSLWYEGNLTCLYSGHYYMHCSWTGRSNHLIKKNQLLIFYRSIIYYLLL